MSDDLRQLVELDGRLGDAVQQLREQHCLIAAIDCKLAHLNNAFLALLSNALRQFRWLEKQRKLIIGRIAAEFSLGPGAGCNEALRRKKPERKTHASPESIS